MTECCLDGTVYSCKWKTLLYETFSQNISSFNPNATVTSYNLKVRTLKKRFYSGGFWWDSWPTNITIDGHSTGSVVNCYQSTGTVDFNGFYYKAWSTNAHTRQRTFKEVASLDNAQINNSAFTVTVTDGSETIICTRTH